MQPAPDSSIMLPHLDTFSKAAELSSFTHAARALQLSQAAVSQRIQTLEQSLGVTLFRRERGRVVLTDAGRQLYDYAQQILALHQEARQKITGQKTPLTGELILAASSIPGEHFLPALLSTYRQKQPHVRVRATIADTQTVLVHVQQGHVHIGLVGGKSDHPSLEFRCFAHDELVLVVPRGHAWENRQRVSLTQLIQEPLILREAGSGTRWCLEKALVDAGKSLGDLHVALELGSNEAIKEAVVQGLGIAFLSRYAVKQEAETGLLHALTVTGLSLVRDIFAVWDRERALPIPARLFLDIVENLEK